MDKILNSIKQRKKRKSTYEALDQTDPDRTRDEFLEEQEKMKEKKEELNKTNLFKSRIIHTEINSSLLFQTVLYFNFFYSIMCFMIQIFSVSFKLWVFLPDNIAWTRLFLSPIFLVFEMIRIQRGYQANIGEHFPDFIFFKIFSVVLIPPCQIMLVVGQQVLPIDYATVLIEMLFIIFELVLSTIAMINVTRRQAAVYYLRNTQTTVFSKEHKIKSSAEIEQELLYNFPHLKEKLYKNKLKKKN